jgi:hypothetical protein
MFESILETVSARNKTSELEAMSESCILEFEEFDSEFSFVEGVAELEDPEYETDEEVILDEDDEEYDGSLIDPELTVDDFSDDSEVMEAVMMCRAALAEPMPFFESESSNAMFESMMIETESSDCDDVEDDCEDDDEMFESMMIETESSDCDDVEDDCEDDDEMFESTSNTDTEYDEDYVSDDELDADTPEEFGAADDNTIIASDEDIESAMSDELNHDYDNSDEDLFNNIMDDESNLLDV